jgi:hypothetical protein
VPAVLSYLDAVALAVLDDDYISAELTDVANLFGRPPFALMQQLFQRTLRPVLLDTVCLPEDPVSTPPISSL